ncbi:MAG TPA: cytochrome P450 [Solirubrobacteraceae bacterium]
MPQTDTELQQRLREYSSYESTPTESYELFEEARAAGCPVARSEKLDGFHMLLAYEDVRAAHRDPGTFSSEPQVLRPIVERPQFPPIEYDPPLQREWRDLFAIALNVTTAKAEQETVRAFVQETIAKLRAQDSFDVVTDLAEEVALFTLCRVLGFDVEKRHDIRRHTIEMHKHADDPVLGPAAFQAFAEFGVAEVMSRLEHPRDDYLTHLATAEIGGHRLSPMELGGAMNSLLNAGHGTTVAGITSLIHEVFTQPEVRDRIAADPALIPAAVDESMRLHTPFFGLYRRVTKDTTVHDVEIPEGDSVFLCWAAANRDPEAFERPNEFDLDRKIGAKRHLAFGFGIHACQGRPLATMQMQTVLGELLEHARALEILDPESVRYDFGGSETAAIKSLRARIPD